jgi:sugar lactone lactonase YvrE
LLGRPTGAAAAADGSLWIVDANLRQLIHVSAGGQILAVWDGLLLDPEGVAVAPDGTVYVADHANYTVYSPDSGGGWRRVAGDPSNPGFGGDGRQARRAQLLAPLDVATDGAGDLFIADAASQNVRFVDAATGIISTVAGNRTAGFAGDGGPATEAEIYGPQAVAVAGNKLFIADTTNFRLRQVDLVSGIISTVAGTGDGTAVVYNPLLTGLQTPLLRISALAVDQAGNAYFPVFWGDHGRMIMRLDPTGTMTRVAGGGTSTAAGVPATDFILPDVLGLAINPLNGDLVICGSDSKVYAVRGVTGPPF